VGWLPGLTGLAALTVLFALGSAFAIELEQFTGAAHAYPAMLDLEGKKVADGELTQQIEDGLLRIRITYDLTKGGRIEEKAAFQQRPELMQKEWSWRELKDGTLQREYKVDFDSGKATARKRAEGGMRDGPTRWRSIRAAPLPASAYSRPPESARPAGQGRSD